MNTLELQNNIIRKVLELKDTDMLLYLQSILDRSKNEDVYQLSEEELQILNESKADYNAGRTHSHEDIMKEMKKQWLDQ